MKTNTLREFITVPRRADHDPGNEWPGVARAIRIARGARDRHEARVTATIAVAVADVLGRDIDEELPDIETLPECTQRQAAALIRLDMGGIGGPRGYAGGSTVRLPAFRLLGKGRWHADDGSAWRAAARDAVARLYPYEGGWMDDVRWLITEQLEEDELLWALCECLRQIEGAWTPEAAHEWASLARLCAEQEDATDAVRRLARRWDVI